VLLATGTLAAVATPTPGAGAAQTAAVSPGALIAQSDNAPSLTPTPQRGSHRSSTPRRTTTAPSRPPTQLPYTGEPTWLVLLGGIALLLSGVALRLRHARWRRLPRC
jgi:LPXTG-motif cell wall-anchored protein